ncbi:MAG TPA: hypothetical protein VK809_06525 [Bacteroidia bacterium]|jgi:hypothetical protein|nr:hypothetical protein [Bacteroidia bacterium]
MKINKPIALLSFCLILGSTPEVFAQSGDAAFEKGSNIINIGVGLGGNYTYFGDGYTSTPDFVISYDNGTFGDVGPGTISLGALVAFKGISYDYTDFRTGYYYNQNWSYYIIGVRGAYHLTIPSAPRFDPYAGLMLGYYDIGYKVSSSDPFFNHPGDPYYATYSNNYASYVAFSLYIGARYYLSNRVGLWLELGYGYTDAALGICFKL